MVRALRNLSIYCPPQTAVEELHSFMAAKLARRLDRAAAHLEAGDINSAAATARTVIEKRLRSLARELSLDAGDGLRKVFDRISSVQALEPIDRSFLSVAIDIGNDGAHDGGQIKPEHVEAMIAIAHRVLRIDPFDAERAPQFFAQTYRSFKRKNKHALHVAATEGGAA